MALANRAPVPTLALMGFLGFTAGIPLSLGTGTQQAWLESLGVDIRLIGLFSLTGLPYTVKVLWSPFLDRFAPPAGARRTGWAALALLGFAACTALLGFTEPRAGLGRAALLSGLAFFLGASTDTCLDAWRTETLPSRWQGAGSSLHITGYRLGMLCAQALALRLSDLWGWTWAFAALGATVLPGALAAFLRREPREPPRPATLREAVVRPLHAFRRRRGAGEMLAFMLLYKLGDNLAMLLFIPFLMQLGFTRSEIGRATRDMGVLAMVAGGILGAWLTHRLRLRTSLLLFGLAQAACILASAALALAGRNAPLMLGAVLLENTVFAMGSVAFMAALAAMCDTGSAATQFAFFTSLSALARVFLPSPAGYLVKALGWPGYYLACALLALPGALLALRVHRWELPGLPAEET